MSPQKFVTHRGGCHCGAVAFEVDAPARLDVQQCNCSVCSMTGFLHLIVPASRFRLLRGAEMLETYTFNTGTARHLFCRRCGIKSFYVPRSNPDGFSVNVRCLDPRDDRARRGHRVRRPQLGAVGRDARASVPRRSDLKRRVRCGADPDDVLPRPPRPTDPSQPAEGRARWPTQPVHCGASRARAGGLPPGDGRHACVPSRPRRGRPAARKVPRWTRRRLPCRIPSS